MASATVSLVDTQALPLEKAPAVGIYESELEPVSIPTSEAEPTPTPSLSNNSLLITSPYTTADHLLDLTTLDTPNRLLAQALTALTPIRDDYATGPYTESFNWTAVFKKLHELAAAEGYAWKRERFYVVAFRSILNADADGDRLHLLDERSHAEAVASGGLLKYWFGSKNAKRENLATCVWRSREDARAGGTGPWHAKARGAAKEMYERIVFTTLELVIGEGVGDWEFSAWKD
ncbi:hypothetical protein BJY00DRAFT_276114 [Aspergillus carlsbadensis]|nr:hypothetical protein BJY00DRAFT_276114 [Aspergillus carlsbadensis]